MKTRVIKHKTTNMLEKENSIYEYTVQRRWFGLFWRTYKYLDVQNELASEQICKYKQFYLYNPRTPRKEFRTKSLDTAQHVAKWLTNPEHEYGFNTLSVNGIYVYLYNFNKYKTPNVPYYPLFEGTANYNKAIEDSGTFVKFKVEKSVVNIYNEDYLKQTQFE